jgi:WD40 repeat protein
MGIGTIKQDTVNWKTICLSTLKQIEGIHTGSAFHHQDIHATYLSLEQITGLDYCRGFLIASADDEVGIWRTDDYELIGLFSVPKRISCLKVQDAKMLVFGHSSGHITVWRLDICNDTCQATLCQEYYGHTGVIMSISLSIDIDLILSGATDFMAKVWCLSTGSLVKTLACHSHWVIQVNLLPTLGCFNSRTLYQGKHSLLTKTRDHVRIFSWPSESKDGNIFGDMNEVETSVIEIPLNPVHNFYTPGCYVQNGKVSYVKQSMVKDDEDGNAEIVMESLATRTRVCEVYLKRKVRKLLAIGEKFALILLPHSHTNKYNLLVIEVSSGNVIGGCHLPHSSSTTPDLAQVVVGETRWLDGLELLKPHDMVIALGMLNGQIRVVTWRDLGDRLTG